MRINPVLLLTLLAVGAHAGESAQSTLRDPVELVKAAKAEIHEIDVEELSGRLDAGVVLVDVREPYEYLRGHLPEAVNIPRGRVEFDILDHPVLAGLSESDPGALADVEIVVYCRTGGRSALAAQSLQSLGFSNVSSLQGGIKAWEEAERPVEE